MSKQGQVISSPVRDQLVKNRLLKCAKRKSVLRPTLPIANQTQTFIFQATRNQPRAERNQSIEKNAVLNRSRFSCLNWRLICSEFLPTYDFHVEISFNRIKLRVDTASLNEF
jgi:hypothetical protein